MTPVAATPDALAPLAAPARPKAPALQRLAARATGSRLFWLLAVGASFSFPFVRSLVRDLPAAPPVLASVPPFALATGSGAPFTERDFAGRLTILQFVPVEALDSGEAPGVLSLLRRVRNAGDAVRLVPVLSAPAGAPTPAVAARLAALAATSAPRVRWVADAGRVLETELSGRLAAAGAGPLAGKLLLVDARGRVRRVASPSGDDLDRMMRDLGFLLNVSER